MDIEPESSHAAASPGQLLFYSTLLEHRHGLPVRSVLLLLRPEANATEVTGLLERRHAPGEEPYKTFRYEVVRVWQLPAESLLTGPLAFVPLAPLTNEAAADLTGTVRQAVARIRADAAPDRVGTMEASLLVLLGLRYEGDIIEGLAAEVREMEESSTYQWIMRKGARSEAVEAILDLGSEKFGTPPPPTAAAVQAITDLERLRRLRRHILAASSWDDLLSTP